MQRVLIPLLIVSLGLAAFVSGFLLWARGPDIGPVEQRLPVSSAPETCPDPPPDTLRILSFNVAYGRGPVDDKGDLRSEATVRDYLSRLAAFIRESGADVVALQEVDFAAHRTHDIDQAEFLARESGLTHSARVTTWHKRYVLYPAWPLAQQYRHVHSGQIVLSRFPLEDNRRYRLPQPAANPALYNWFYLNRAVQRVDVRLGAERRLRLFNVHLEAFDVPNKMIQAGLLVERVRAEGTPHTLVLGDFNCVPPEATLQHAFPDEPETDMRADRTIATMRELSGFADALERHHPDPRPEELYTFPAPAPNRRLDYLYFGEAGLKVVAARVAREAGPISDHLPLIADLRWLEP